MIYHDLSGYIMINHDNDDNNDNDKNYPDSGGYINIRGCFSSGEAGA